VTQSALSVVNAPTPTIATADLQIGMFIHLDLGWMSHPFALSSFRITDANQIATIRSLGLARVRWSPEHSDPALLDAPVEGPAAAESTPDAQPAQNACAEPVEDASTIGRARARALRDRRIRALSAQHAAVELVERQYGEASNDWRAAADQAASDPQAAGQRMSALSRALVDKMIGARELSIRAVAQTGSDRASHALNVGVISLLLGRLCGLSEPDLSDLGVGALSHDIGKLDLPPRLHRPDDTYSASELAAYREHVALGVALGKRMGLAPGALLVIGQHHEYSDGTGFPQGVDGNRMSVASRVVALVNRYDNLCHPAPAVRAMTPHEALSFLFAQGQKRFDPAMLSSFVRMMGVYPPGSIVQLTDDRYAIVESVNAARPLKPKVMVHDPQVPREATLLIDLAHDAILGIRRSLPADQLPPPVRENLVPRHRTAWFFETSGEAATDADAGDEERVRIHH